MFGNIVLRGNCRGSSLRNVSEKIPSDPQWKRFFELAPNKSTQEHIYKLFKKPNE